MSSNPARTSKFVEINVRNDILNLPRAVQSAKFTIALRPRGDTGDNGLQALSY